MSSQAFAKSSQPGSPIQDLAKVESLTITNSLDTEIEPDWCHWHGTSTNSSCWWLMQHEQLEKSLSKVKRGKIALRRLGNSNFVDKAPPEVVEGARTWQKLSSSGNFAGSAARFSITKGNATSSSGAKKIEEFQARWVCDYWHVRMLNTCGQ